MCKGVREGLMARFISDQKPEGSQRVDHVAIWETVFQVEGPARAKALGWSMLGMA